MATNESLDHPAGSQISRLISEYRPILYFVGGVFGFLFAGYAVDILAGPLNKSTTLLHQISGLLAAVGLVLAVCGAVVGLLWAGLFISKR